MDKAVLVVPKQLLSATSLVVLLYVTCSLLFALLIIMEAWFETDTFVSLVQRHE